VTAYIPLFQIGVFNPLKEKTEGFSMDVPCKLISSLYLMQILYLIRRGNKTSETSYTGMTSTER